MGPKLRDIAAIYVLRMKYCIHLCITVVSCVVEINFQLKLKTIQLKDYSTAVSNAVKDYSTAF